MSELQLRPCWRLDLGSVHALAHGVHPDPFGVLGPHQSEDGRVIRAFLPGACKVDVLRRNDRAHLATLACTGTKATSLKASWPIRHLIYCASIGRKRSRKQKTHIRSGCLLGDVDLFLVQRGPPLRAEQDFRRTSHDGRRRRTACDFRFGRRTPRAWRWSATSIHGTVAATRCACGIRPASGNCSCRGSRPGARYKYDILGPGGDAGAAQSRSGRAANGNAAGDRVDRRRAERACLARSRLDERARGAAGARRTDLDLRNARRVVALARARPRRHAMGLHEQEARPLSGRDGLHARGIPADHRASIRRLVGLSAARSVCTERAVWTAKRLRAVRRNPA